MNIAIIGAGMAGLSLARGLKPGCEVTIFEKSRGIGGRMSTRYNDHFQFDHGAQYFTARSDEFRSFLKPYIEQGIVRAWEPKIVTLEKGEKPYKRDWFEPHYVAAPKMTSLCKEMAKGLNVVGGVRIIEINRNGEHWMLIDQDEQQYGPFDWVVSSAPAEQAVDLIPDTFSEYGLIQNSVSQGCFSLMLGFHEPLALNWQLAMVKNSTISLICVNSSKPERDQKFSIIVQTDNAWAEENLEADESGIKDILLSELSALLSIEINPDHIAMHRWRYARVSKPADTDFLIDHTNKLAACGDWCIGGRVESTFLSGYRLARAI